MKRRMVKLAKYLPRHLDFSCYLLLSIDWSQLECGKTHREDFERVVSLKRLAEGRRYR